MTENGTANIQIPAPVQQYCDAALDDPFPSFSMRTFNVGAMIRDHLKNLIEDCVEKNWTTCTCTNLDRLLLLIYELEISCMPVDNDGSIDRTATPLILDRHLDLCPLFKIHAMNRAMHTLIDHRVDRSVSNQCLCMISISMHCTSKCPSIGKWTRS
jgi:hypothetical protein